MATRRRSAAAHAHRLGPGGADRRADSRSNRGRSAPSTRRRRRGTSRPRLARSAAILTLVAAALVLVGGGLGTWDAILRPLQVADRAPLVTEAPEPGSQDGGPVVWSSGRDLEERSEGIRREGRPIPPAELTGYQWPVPNAVLVGSYGPSEAGSFSVDGRRFNDGIDLATACGDPIVAAHSGIVIAAGRRYDAVLGWLGDLADYYGRLDRDDAWKEVPIGVVVDDGNGYRSIYTHFKSVAVTVGQRVGAGELLGYEGRTGGAESCRLHYAIFSPHETASIRLVKRIADRTLLPGHAIARIDPLTILPPADAADISLAD
jgi:murein DD-endopeptidase MepM/ murein hydrolase activator NlpD